MMAALDPLDPVALVAAIAVLLTGIAALITATRRSRRLIERQLDPHNEKTAGDTLHEISQTVQYVADVQHVQTQTLDAHGQLIKEIADRTGRVEAKVDETKEVLTEHTEERKTFEPLIGWVQRQMAEESAEKEET